MKNNIPSASAQYTLSFYTACVDIGADPKTILDMLGTTDSEFTNPIRRFSCDSILDMLTYTRELTGHKSIGLECGQNFRPDTFADVGLAVISTQTLRHSHIVNAKYQKLTQQFGTTAMDVKGQTARILWEPYIDDPERLRPVTEAVYVGCVAIARWLLWDENAEALVVKFRHAKPCEPDPYIECYGCEVLYDQPYDSLEYDISLANIKLPQANPNLLKSLEIRLDKAVHNLENQNLIKNQVHQCIQHLLSNSPVNLPAVSNIIGHSEQTVARRLKDENSSFRAILRDVRRETADFYLSEGHKTLTEIALALGYSDHSAFTRAYKSWYGHAPSARDKT
jgi:AraC-like DNA-binding protein